MNVERIINQVRTLEEIYSEINKQINELSSYLPEGCDFTYCGPADGIMITKDGENREVNKQLIKELVECKSDVEVEKIFSKYIAI